MPLPKWLEGYFVISRKDAFLAILILVIAMATFVAVTYLKILYLKQVAQECLNLLSTYTSITP